MNINVILEELDAEVSRLQQIRATIQSLSETSQVVPARRGRPLGSTNTPKAKLRLKLVLAKPLKNPKRQLSPAGRKAIQKAMKKRWADKKLAEKAALQTKKKTKATRIANAFVKKATPVAAV